MVQSNLIWLSKARRKKTSVSKEKNRYKLSNRSSIAKSTYIIEDTDSNPSRIGHKYKHIRKTVTSNEGIELIDNRKMSYRRRRISYKSDIREKGTLINGLYEGTNHYYSYYKPLLKQRTQDYITDYCDEPTNRRNNVYKVRLRYH